MNDETLVEAMTAGGLSRKTITVYLVALRAARAAGVDPDTVNAVELRTYAETLPRTRWSRQLLRSALLAYWKISGRESIAGAIPVPTKPRMRCRALEDCDASLLAAAARKRGDRKGLAVLLGLYTGLRRNEIASLRWSDVDPEGWLTIVGKGNVTRTFPLHPALRPTMERLRERRRPSRRGHDWIFRGRWQEPVHPTTIWTWVREVAAGAGLPAVPTHVLRHTALATALDNCRDLRAVQELAGHAWPETTAGYTRVTRRRLVDAVGAIQYGEESA